MPVALPPPQLCQPCQTLPDAAWGAARSPAEQHRTGVAAGLEAGAFVYVLEAVSTALTGTLDLEV